MTVKISRQKTLRILQLFFKGTSQPDIAKLVGVDQATISRYVSKLKSDAEIKGLLAAAKEYGVMDEVSSLRSLAVELSKSKLTAEETKDGIAILKIFNSQGVSPSEHKTLVKVIAKVKNEDFVDAAIKLANLEDTTGKNFTEIVSKFEKISAELIQKEMINSDLKQKNEKLGQSITELTVAKTKKQQELQQLEKQIKQKQSELESVVLKKMKETDLTLDRIKKLEPVVQTIKKVGVSDVELETFLNEHEELEAVGISWVGFQAIVEPLKNTPPIDAKRLGKRLAEYGSVDRSTEVIKTEFASLEPLVEKLKEERTSLKSDVESLTNNRKRIKEEVEDLNNTKQRLSQSINVMQNQKKQFEIDIPQLENRVKVFEARASILQKANREREQELAVMEEKLKISREVDVKLSETKKLLQELEAKKVATRRKFELFEGFLGFIGARTASSLAKFINLLPETIEWALEGKYDVDLIKRVIINELIGHNSLNVLGCAHCGTEFVVVKRSVETRTSFSYDSKDKYCPVCGTFSYVTVRKDITQMLKKEFELPKFVPVIESPGNQKKSQDS